VAWNSEKEDFHPAAFLDSRLARAEYLFTPLITALEFHP